MLSKKILCTLGLMMGANSIAYAGTNFTQLKTLNQTEFNRLAKDLNSAASYKAVTPAAATGLTGFDIGAEVSFTQLANSSVWQKAGADVSTLILPKLHVHKGLPFNLDIGASLSSVPNSDMKLMGFEARYALLEGNLALPAVAVRGAYSKLSGVSQLAFDSTNIELLVSKGFVMFTPYAGIGRVWGSVTPNVNGLQKASPTSSKVFAGVNANFGLMNLATELDRTGDNQTVSIKLGFRW
ncbi:DUF6588 family protein [Undibacterium fentianense]|uniref:Outer membrane protein beta-barrel domain-containing protein n=1 Tax=Undibacterium fentianense TaxID=2828728 RepID=A0A941E1P3_9BURK|nr:DUF6588 family protein [Undibacterium fentianense]MBR7799627.1 hypothetical protein [Undibacterium fentianense]